jgi:hypothetical protein
MSTHASVCETLSSTDIAGRLLVAETRAVATLAAGVAYELEAPLLRLLTTLRALSAASPASLPDDGPLARALHAAERIDATVRGLGAFAPAEETSQGVDVHDVIELAIHLVMPELAGRARIKRAYGPVKRVRGSRGKLVHVLLSVLRNAATAIPLGMPEANTVFIHTGLGPDGHVIIDVVDTGVGIEPDDLDFVFDPFFTTKPSPESPGLGLASTRGALTEIGGTIEIESVVGHGTRLALFLPMIEQSEGTSLASLVRCDARADRRVLCVSCAGYCTRPDVICDEDARLVFATVDDAIVRLASGEAYDLILCDGDAAGEGGFRERLARMAPEAVPRMFTLPRPNRSGLYERRAAAPAAAQASSRR